MSDHTMQIGEGFAGSGVNAAHVNTVLGAKEGPVGHGVDDRARDATRRARAVRRGRAARTSR